MAYQIPQNLKYEEKIVFGLTLKQFAWIGLFGIIAAIIFLKTDLNFLFKAIIAITCILLGIGFAYFDFLSHTRILKKYFFSMRQAGYLDPKLNSFVEVKEIKEDTLFLKDGSKLAIIQVLPIHFSMLSNQEQKAIVNSYREFLNSLDFSIQIVMRTISLSLNEYLAVLQKKVEKTRKISIATQFESFKEFIQKFITDKKVKNRLFYIIVPAPHTKPRWWPNKKKVQKEQKIALKQLNIRVQVCQEKLKRCNLLTNRLNTQELVSLLASFFEGFIEAQNEYLSTITTLQEGEKIETKKRIWFNAKAQKLETNPK